MPMRGNYQQYSTPFGLCSLMNYVDIGTYKTVCRICPITVQGMYIGLNIYIKKITKYYFRVFDKNNKLNNYKYSKTIYSTNH